MNVLAAEPMCAHCIKAKATVIEVRADLASLRAENADLRRQVHEMKLAKLVRKSKRRHVEKRDGFDLVTHLEGIGLGVINTGPLRWRAQCPAHEDRDPSLQITEKPDGQVLIHCWSGGCSPEEILGAIGWEFAHLRARD